MTEYAYIIALLPALSFVLIVFFLRFKEFLAAGFSIAMIVIGWILSIVVLAETLGRGGEAYEGFFHITSFASLNFEFGILVDPLTAMMLIVVTTVASCVQIYSIGYMKGDPRFSRFFAYLSLFCFSMLGLVLANNFFMIFIFWELVGLTSYLLIGFWFEKKVAADAGKKAFITTRIGDLGFIIGLLMIATYTGTFNYGEVFSRVAGGAIPAGALTVALVFLFGGAIGKSAQFPLHVWLPDAMEGPTPVSALIHAATMVVAGVYLVARAMPIFSGSAEASLVVATIGIITSLLAASIGLVQNDIKRVLAYSTVSQLGYMIMALGLYGHDTALGHHSPGYYAGTFHLMTHAFFKGLLFLGAGSVIHAVHTNDIQEMGGLAPKMKTTALTFMIASLSIAGIFPFAGFWSKDEIVAAASYHPVFLVLTLAVAFMTAFYMWRLCFLTFFGKPRDQHRFDHAHESPRVMTWPLVFLAVLSVVAGWVGLPWLSQGFASFVFHGEAYHPHANWLLMAISTVVAVAGIGLAWLIYYKKKISADRLAERFRPIYTLLYNKYYFDELYDLIIVRPVLAFATFMWSFDNWVIDGLVNGIAKLTILWSDLKLWFDTWIVDGAVNGAGWIVQQGSALLRFVQAGAVQFYALFLLVAMVLLALVKFEVVMVTVDWPVLSVIMLAGIALLVLVSRTAHRAGPAEATADTGSVGVEKEE
ncbi:MAG: NADH-quinone oxidoreductase subunit L [Candidatus Zixiibacteriota bacterium]|nr:MAG: NADH-quinone oxidoreductase subunit L [candidate division Zixibacteria bacterium]